MKPTIVAAAVLCVLGAGGCQPKLDLPDGFVEVPDRADGLYDLRAVSADGVALAVRTHSNPDGGTLEFWAEAVRNELTTARGYQLLTDEPVESAAGEAGRLMTLSARRGGVEFTYLVAVYVPGRKVSVVEAGGRADAVKGRLGALKNAMLTLR